MDYHEKKPTLEGRVKVTNCRQLKKKSKKILKKFIYQVERKNLLLQSLIILPGTLKRSIWRSR